MAEIEQQEPNTPQAEPEMTPKQKRSMLRRSLVWIGVLLLILVGTLTLMFSTDKGSRFLLDRVLSKQSIIQYQYESGNLLKGIILKNIIVSLKPVDIKIDRADVSLGWRAIVNKEIHLSHGDVNNLRIIMKSPPSDEPFKFTPIKLPFVLRIDDATVDHLQIATSSGVKVDFNDIELHEFLDQLNSKILNHY